MKRAIESVNDRMLAAVQRRQPTLVSSSQVPRIVAVSKLKPTSSIIEAYECGQRYFGENYIQELEEKSNSVEIIEKCPDIKFHFIGHLQSNKVNKLLKVKNLHMMETIESIKLADLVNKALERHQSSLVQDDVSDEQVGHLTKPTTAMKRLKVLIQINTSGEEQKSGIDISEAPNLAEHIVKRCQWLDLAGLMTIGRLEGWEGDGPNQDFVRLYNAREVISDRLSIDENTLELSMGMSGDFEEAITLGSSSVRVGTLIFGERQKS